MKVEDLFNGVVVDFPLHLIRNTPERTPKFYLYFAIITSVVGVGHLLKVSLKLDYWERRRL